MPAAYCGRYHEQFRHGDTRNGAYQCFLTLSDPDGLPCGVQFIAALGREDLLLQLAGQLEQAQPWFAKRPGLLG